MKLWVWLRPSWFLPHWLWTPSQDCCFQLLFTWGCPGTGWEEDSICPAQAMSFEWIAWGNQEVGTALKYYFSFSQLQRLGKGDIGRSTLYKIDLINFIPRFLNLPSSPCPGSSVLFQKSWISRFVNRSNLAVQCGRLPLHPTHQAQILWATCRLCCSHWSTAHEISFSGCSSWLQSLLWEFAEKHKICQTGSSFYLLWVNLTPLSVEW